MPYFKNIREKTEAINIARIARRDKIVKNIEDVMNNALNDGLISCNIIFNKEEKQTIDDYSLIDEIKAKGYDVKVIDGGSGSFYVLDISWKE